MLRKICNENTSQDSIAELWKNQNVAADAMLAHKLIGLKTGEIKMLLADYPSLKVH